MIRVSNARSLRLLPLPLPLLLLLLAARPAAALNNGLARVPYMGFSSWFAGLALGSSNGCVSDAFFNETADAFASSGLLAAGFDIIGLDCYWTSARDAATGDWLPDPTIFAGGLAGYEAVLAHIKARGMKVWGYTDRGTALCSGVNGTGSLGREARDAAWFAARGVDFVKEDSCSATDDHEAAFAQYALMRDGINATGRPTIFNLCGWNPFYAPVGHALANSWRIGPDAAQWSTILVNLDFSSDVWRFAGPGGFNDLDMLGGCTVFGPMSSLQRRAQFVAYAMAASPLVLSVDVRSLAPEDLDTYSNAEVIAVGRDPLGRRSLVCHGACRCVGRRSL